MKTEANYDPQAKKATYTHRIHHAEVMPDTKILDNGPDDSIQNLSAPKGTAAGLRALKKR